MRKPKTKLPIRSAHARSLGVSLSHLYRVVNGERKSPELLARYRALIAADPDARLGVKVSFIPPGTVFSGGTPEDLARAKKEAGAHVRIEGGEMVLVSAFTLSCRGEGPFTLRPVAEP